MSPRTAFERLLGLNGSRTYSASADAARRAMRAKHHLEQKRSQERRRRQRQRDHADRLRNRSPYRGVLSWVLFAVALNAGIFLAEPLNERIRFRTAPIEQVDVQGTSALTPEAIVEAAGLSGLASPPRNTEEIVQAIEAEPWIESARALRLPTGALMISVVERDAIARWQVDPESETRLVDQRGERFDGALEPGGALPLVSGSTNELDSTLPGEAVEILRTLERYSSLAKDPRALTLYLPSVEASSGTTETDDQTGYVLQLGTEGPKALLGRRLLEERVARLAALVESGESAFLAAQLIDLRYADRAVLRTEPVSG